MTTAPKVSIISTTYNQEKYIRQALDSLVSQETDFDFEIVIADDCSTDKTAERIEKYAQKYPNIFKINLRKKNIGSWANYLSVLRAARGEFIAICEGDDFWTDTSKLQRQVNFLEKRPGCAMCFHPVRVFFENQERSDYVYPDPKANHKFTTLELLKNNFIQTNSVMYRRQKYNDMPTKIIPGDWYLHLYHAQFGKIGFIDRVMSAYRRHTGGLWWDSHEDIDRIWERFGIPHLELYVEFLKLYGNDANYREIINTHIGKMFGNFIGVDTKHNKKLLQEVIITMPDITAKFIADQYNQLVRSESSFKDTKQEIETQKQEIDTLKYEIELRNQMLQQKEQILRAIKLSRFWKFRNLIARVTGKEMI
jgi:glycosyltransferase involved in cell wall biosynthesis